jgi:polyferredoxin
LEPPILWALAALMAMLTALLLKRGHEIRTLADAGVVLLLLTMMASMFASAVVYLYFPEPVTLFELVALNMISMSVALIPILTALIKGDRSLDETRRGHAISSRSVVFGAVVGLAILSEVFMGWTFAIASGAASTVPRDALGSLLGSMGTYWFLFTMAAEMGATLYLVGRGLPRAFRWLVVMQATIMVLSPTAISSPLWTGFSLWAGSGVMIVAIIFIMEHLYKNRTLAAGALRYIVLLLGVYALMMAGIFVWQLYGQVTIFVASIVAEMALYFGLVLDGKKLSAPPLRGWLSTPLLAFALLLSVFVVEFFMGGVLDVQANGAPYFTTLPFASLSGPALTAAGAGFYDLIVFVSSITASFIFLAMMGVEMGALVVFKIRDSRDMETKIRLGLVIAAYAIYSLFLPVFVFPATISKVPWIGWSMGLGTAGALAPAVLLALVATYLVSGSLSFLFGSRQVCSLFCTAALMYQGTTIDAMSSFNRTSTVGRRYLTSRIPSAYKAVVSLVWASLLIAAVLSYLTSVGVIDVTIFGQDTGFFLYSFYFSFLWYVVWVLTPFVGTYGCATTGVCGWGAFNQLVSRIGLFRIRVRDGDTCVNCKTKDCAKVCPVGLTDLPGSFIDKGEFRSFKCIGVGDCVSACPYDNIFFFDVRNWIRMKLHRPLPLPSRSGPGVSEGMIDFRQSRRETGTDSHT